MNAVDVVIGPVRILSSIYVRDYKMNTSCRILDHHCGIPVTFSPCSHAIVLRLHNTIHYLNAKSDLSPPSWHAICDLQWPIALCPRRRNTHARKQTTTQTSTNEPNQNPSDTKSKNWSNPRCFSDESWIKSVLEHC